LVGLYLIVVLRQLQVTSVSLFLFVIQERCLSCNDVCYPHGCSPLRQRSVTDATALGELYFYWFASRSMWQMRRAGKSSSCMIDWLSNAVYPANFHKLLS